MNSELTLLRAAYLDRMEEEYPERFAERFGDVNCELCADSGLLGGADGRVCDCQKGRDAR